MLTTRPVRVLRDADRDQVDALLGADLPEELRGLAPTVEVR